MDEKIDEYGGQDYFPKLYKYASSNVLVVSYDLLPFQGTPFETHLMICKILCRIQCRKILGCKILSILKLNQY